MSEFHDQLRKEFTDSAYREAYADSFIDSWIALQIRVIREQRNMTQKDLANVLHTTQTAISRLENANYSGRSIGTLKSVAKAFDCRLKVSFETYGSLVEEAEEFSSGFLHRPNFKDEFASLANLPEDLTSSENSEKPPIDSTIKGMVAPQLPRGPNVHQLPRKKLAAREAEEAEQPSRQAG